jgi:hypothetical protein
MINVKVYSVDVVDCEVDDDIEEYESWEDLINELEDEHDEDVDGTSIRELDNGDNITIRGDVWFKVYKLIEN